MTNPSTKPEGGKPEAKTLVHLFVRTCRDSGFSMDAVKAAIFTGEVAHVSPLQIWIAVGSFDTMERIANGQHRAAHDRSVYP